MVILRVIWSQRNVAPTSAVAAKALAVSKAAAFNIFYKLEKRGHIQILSHQCWPITLVDPGWARQGQGMKAGIDKDKHWYVVRTNVKAEAKAADNIRKVGYETYLPRRRLEVKNQRTHTYSISEQPLMPRYLFVAFFPKDANFYRVNGCDGVECVLSIDGRPMRVSGDSVETIFLAEIDMAFDDTRAARIHRKEEAASAKENTAKRFPAGMDIFVSEGSHPFANLRGTVDEITKAGRIIALIDLFGRMTPVEFEAMQLVPAL